MATGFTSAIVLLGCCLALCGGESFPAYPISTSIIEYSVLENPPTLVKGRVDGAAAWGSLLGSALDSGTYVLDVHSAEGLDGPRQAFAAGYLEGSLTAALIWDHMRNFWSIDFKLEPPRLPKAEADFVEANLDWMRRQVQLATATGGKNSSYWAQVGHLLHQLEGLTAGFNANKPVDAQELTSQQMMLMTLVDGDMDDIKSALAARVGRRLASLSERKPHRTHCSALVQLAPDGSELWTAHTNWDDYRAMLRVVKYFDMPLPGAIARRLSFDSYPGGLSSMTDFYRTSTGLTITETTLDVAADDLWSHVVPESMLTWARALVANRLATTGDEWTALQLLYQSGTCNNQWLVVDYKLFTAGSPVQPGTLWISETMPGTSERADVSSALMGNSRAWFSFNIPYFRHISEVGGYVPPKDVEDSYENCSRAKMWAREVSSPSIRDLDSFVAFMRHVDPKDPIAKGDTCKAISARCDLNSFDSPNFACFGAIDIKVAAVNSGDLGFFAAMSPSWRSDIPAFDWNVQGQGCKDFKHMGHPDVFNFPMYKFPNSPEDEADVLTLFV